MNYHLYLFNSSPPDLTANRAVQSFTSFAQPVDGIVRVFECSSADLSFCPIPPEDFGVRVFPTLVFAAVTGQNRQGTTVHPHRRLTGAGITRERILANLEQLRRSPPIVQHGGSRGNYDGDGQGEGSLINLLLPPWLLMASILATSYKTLSANTVTGKAIYGSLATLGLLSWYDLPPERRRFLPGIGNAPKSSPYAHLSSPNRSRRLSLPSPQAKEQADGRRPRAIGSARHPGGRTRYHCSRAGSGNRSTVNVLGHGLL